MQFHTLQRAHPNRKSVQVGRGGKRGKTSGRGGKGQTARAGHKMYPQIRDMIKRIPKLRGRGKHGLKSFQREVAPVNLDVLERVFESNTVISPAVLLEKGVIAMHSGVLPRVKILGRGTLSKKLMISGCSVSGTAKAAIEKAGGTISL
ncbi:MAG: uL15 family ribosomal protein [bacterium]|nr:uL15 family ribosomal protein [bacterium]